MHCIIISPVALLPAADAFAQAAGLATGQFTVDYEPNHMLCAFTPSETALVALDGTIPEWMQIILTDNPGSPAWDEGSGTDEDPGKVGVFLSASQGGWVHKATVDGWPRA
jgi:hypothetical protein